MVNPSHYSFNMRIPSREEPLLPFYGQGNRLGELFTPGDTLGNTGFLDLSGSF